MTILQAFILGLVQGLTEFLPVSSSGHLVVIQSLMGVADPSVFFEVFLHFATLLAIVVFFWRRLLKLTKRDFILLAAASIPAGIFGALLGDYIIDLFSNLTLVAIMLLITGLLNLGIDERLAKETAPPAKELEPIQLSIRQALVIGIFQMFAIIPGITRSGATVFGGLWQGLSRFSAFEFSFLMAIPVIIGANAFELKKLGSASTVLPASSTLFVGFLTAFIVGIFSLRLLRYMTQKARFEVFAHYSFLAGGTLLVLRIFSVI